MNWDDLDGFRRVATHLSFSRAAEELGMSTPTLSQRVSRLERAVDAKLFLRTTRTVRLTPAGQILFDFADRTASGWRTVLHEITAADRPTARRAPGEVRLGICAPSPFDLLDRLRAARPETIWRMSLNDSMTRAAADLADGLVLALAWYGWPYAHESELPSAVTVALAREELWVSLPETHPLARSPRVDLAALAGEDWVASPQPTLKLMLQRSCRHAGDFEPRISHETDDRTHIAYLVASGQAVHLDSPSGPPAGGVVRRPVHNAPTGELRLSWDTERLPSSVAHVIRAELIAGYAASTARHNPEYWHDARPAPARQPLG